MSSCTSCEMEGIVQQWIRETQGWILLYFEPQCAKKNADVTKCLLPIFTACNTDDRVWRQLQERKDGGSCEGNKISPWRCWSVGKASLLSLTYLKSEQKCSDVTTFEHTLCPNCFFFLFLAIVGCVWLIISKIVFLFVSKCFGQYDWLFRLY